MKEKREGGAVKSTRKPVSLALSKAGFSRKINRRGFSLAEVLIVVAVIAVLVGIAVPVFASQLEKNRDSITATNLRAAYDEANATLLSRGQKPSDGAKVTVDGVDYRSTDNSLSGETLPFALGNGLPSGAGIYSLEFSFNKDTATVMTWSGEASGSGSGTIPAPMSPPPTAEQKPTLEDISVTNFKDNYLEGESFDKSDMVVKAIYSDGNESTVTSYSCTNVGPYAIAGSYTVKVSYQGITKELTVTVNKRTVTELVIVTPPDKTEYLEGEYFKPDGMVVNAKFSDGTEEENVAYSYRPTGELRESDMYVTVSYEGAAVLCPITVGDRILESITVSGKTEYEEGEIFDPSRLEVTANYTNARPRTIAYPDFSCTLTPDESPLNKGEYQAVVTYTEGENTKSKTVTVAVNQAPLTKLTVEVKDDYYYVGDTFSTSGLIVMATYDNKYVTEYTEELVTGYTYTLDPALASADAELEEGNYEVTVAYLDKSASATFTVTESSLKELAVVVKDTVTYYVGDTVKNTDLTVTAKYANDHTKVIDSYTLNSVDPLVEGNNTISVTYQEKTATTTYTASKAALQNVTVEITKSYCVGDTFNASELKVTATYVNGYSEVLSASDYSVALSPNDTPLKENATYTVTVTYDGTPYTATFKPTKAALQGVTVEITKSYYVGDTFDASEVKVTATYENGFKEVVPASDYTVALSPNDSKLKENETYTVTVTYNGAPYTDTFTVEDFAPLSSIAVVVTGTYYVGDTVKKTDLTVTATYENGHTKEIDDYTILNNVPLVKGTNTISVTYQEKPASTELTVDYAALKDITVGIEKTYYVGDTFNESDVKVTATYANNDYSETITSGYTVTLNPNDVTLQEREYEVTVTYNEKPYKATFDVTYAAVVSIDFQFRDLDSTTSFSKDNLLVKATYANGHSDTISTGYDYTLDPNHDPLRYSTKYTVTVTYQDPGVPSKSYDFTTPEDPNSGGGGGGTNPCFAPGTLITLADGTRKPIEELSFDDMLLVWDFKTGTYDAQPAVLLIDHGEHTYSVIGLHFSDGALLRIVGEHGVFDYDLNRFVYLSSENAEDYIGHRFVKCVPEGGYDLVTLDSVEISVEQITALSIVSSGDFNVFASDLLTLSPPKEVFDLIPMGETLRYDMDLFRQLVAEYGTYDYEVYAQFATREQYEALNGAYMKIPVEMGLLSFEELWALFESIIQFMN